METPLPRSESQTNSESQVRSEILKHLGMERPEWDDYFMQLALLASTRATCLRRSVGAVLVRDRHVLSTGYNGSPPGMPHCTQAGCLMEEGHCVRTIHAEQNAILQSAQHGVVTRGATLYTTYRPCIICSRMVVGAGIVRVVYYGEDPQGWSHEVLSSAGVELKRMQSPLA